MIIKKHNDFVDVTKVLRTRFKNKQNKRLAGPKIKDDGGNHCLARFFDECKKKIRGID